MRKLTIEFDTDDLALSFASWLCNIGEQYFMDCCDIAVENGETERTITGFEYHPIVNPDEPEDCIERYGDFLSDWTIRTVSKVEKFE